MKAVGIKPIVVQTQTVGYLGYIPRLQMVASLENVFQAQQARSFAAIALGLLTVGLIVSLPAQGPADRDTALQAPDGRDPGSSRSHRRAH